MKKPPTDYDAIASRYDADRARFGARVDEHLAQWLVGPGAVLLDVGCGTGAWLAAQRPLGVVRVGVDRARAMLDIAVARDADARYIHGRAEALPFASESVAVATSRFAFHHFDDCPAFLAEAARVLEPGGLLELMNVMPLEDASWWIYELFPAARAIDEQRFPASSDLIARMRSSGFEHCTHDVESFDSEWTVREQRERVRERVISQLALLDDDDWRAGLAGLEAKDPEERVPMAGRTHTFTAVRSPAGDSSARS